MHIPRRLRIAVENILIELGFDLGGSAPDGFQPLDSDLTAISAIDSSTAGALVSDGSGWIRKSYAQLKTALGLVKADVGLGNVQNLAPANLPVSTATQTALDGKVDENSAITPGTKTKLTYDAKGLITSGTDATTADIDDSADRRYVTDAQLAIIEDVEAGGGSGLELGETDTTAYRGDRGKTAYDHSQATGNPHGTVPGDITGFGAAALAAAPAETAASLGATISGATAATPNDSDLVATVESSVVKKITWTAVKAFLKTYFDGVYQALLVSGTNIKTINSTSLLGSGDISITSGVALGETSSTAYRGDRGKTAYDHSQATGNAHSATQDDIGDGTTYKQYSATEKTKLSGIATGATANDTDANLKARGNHTGTQSADTLTDGTTNKAFLATERTKLAGIATGATANDTDANLKARGNHTGTQSADTITDGTTNKAFLATERTKLAGIETAADVTDAANVAAAGAVMNTGNETVAGIKTFSSSPIVPTPTTDFQAATKKYVDDAAFGGGGYTDEQAQDTIGSILTDTDSVDLAYDDVGGTITADVIQKVVANSTATFTETITKGNKAVLHDATAASITHNLPTAVGNKAILHIKKTDASVNTVTADGFSTELVEGSATAVLRRQYESITLVSDGSNWVII
jgi:hypothetical protein